VNVEKLSSWISRLFTAAACVLFAVGLAEWLLGIDRGKMLLGYEPGRLAEFAAMFLFPVVVVLLRQIREELRKK
jgi:uncharacterized membrane protein AbrB (regulator of aidB expression)